MRKATVAGLVVASLLVGGGSAIAQSVDSDQSILQRQRELLIQKRREEQRTRTLLEISPQTGKVEAAPTASGESAVLSATPAPTKKTTTASSGQSRAEAATAAVPAELAPEDQLFRPIKFAYDSAYIDDPARETLMGLCSTLKADLSANPGSSYFVIGHTDAAGSDDYNLALSQRRAEATKDFLVRSCGIETAQIEAIGMGEQRLLASADPRGATQRRVEIQVRLDDSGG